MTGCDSGCDSGGLEVTHFRLDVTITSITSITSGFWPDVTLDGSLPGGHPIDEFPALSESQFVSFFLFFLTVTLWKMCEKPTQAVYCISCRELE